MCIPFAMFTDRHMASINAIFHSSQHNCYQIYFLALPEKVKASYMFSVALEKESKSLCTG